MTFRGLLVAPVGPLADARALAHLALVAESYGWDGFFVWDHLMRPDAQAPVADVWTVLAMVALATHRIRFGPMVTALPRRRPQVVARQTQTLASSSDGRLILGVGTGVDTAGEFSKFGEPGTTGSRAAALEDGVTLLKALWTGAEVWHRGSQYSAEGVQFVPPGDRVMSIPIWVGSRRGTGRPLRLAVTCEGYFPLVDLQDFEIATAEIRKLRDGVGDFDLVAAGSAADDPRPWVGLGATWWLVRVVEGTSVAGAAEIVARWPQFAD